MDSPSESSIFAKSKKFFVHQAPLNDFTEVPWLGEVDESHAKNQAQLLYLRCNGHHIVLFHVIVLWTESGRVQEAAIYFLMKFMVTLLALSRTKYIRDG